MKKPTYPILAQFMAKHGLIRKDISNIIGVCYRQVLKKLTFEKTSETTNAVFDIVEARKIVEYFKSKGENVTIDLLFFGDVDTNVNDTQY